MASSVSTRSIRRRLFAVAGVLYLSACRYVTTSPTTDTTSTAPATDSTSLTYTADVAPILNADLYALSLRVVGARRRESQFLFGAY